jgi:4-diphosphocytidyl-2C-methyl-D-erythritol kinase
MDKTRRMYSELDSASFTDGSFADNFLEDSKRGRPPVRLLRYNAFEGVANAVFSDMDRHRGAMRAAGAKTVHLCGAGPAVYSTFQDVKEAESVAFRLHGQESGRVVFAGRIYLPAQWHSHQGEIILCQTLGSRRLRNKGMW